MRKLPVLFLEPYFDFQVHIVMVASVGGYPNLSKCMGGLDMEWSKLPHTQ